MTQKNKDSKVIIGLTVKKSEDFAKWYSEVLLKAELIQYYDVAGCYILRPYIYKVWEYIMSFMNEEFAKYGIDNCYFPMFVTRGKLEAEENHLEGFKAEVAWVTKSGSNDLAEPIAIRPTSETIMYPTFAKWIRSHRDLPLKLNQWCPVVRWEFSNPTPFIRTREFLWQEGHTAHASATEADDFAVAMAKIYEKVYTELLAVPVTLGVKSELEKFAGGDKTYTVEAFVSTNGRSIQAATSHYLGSNFAKIYGVSFENSVGEFEPVYQTSFGLSTRSIGTMILTHGDDTGLVLPPKVAHTQVIIIPIVTKKTDTEKLLSVCDEVEALLKSSSIRVKTDNRENYSPGYKYNDWELKGIPIRLEIGARDLENGTCRLVRRVDSFKQDINRSDLVSAVKQMLSDAHDIMYNNAVEKRKNSRMDVTNWDQVKEALQNRKTILTPWCNQPECEKHVKAETAKLSQECSFELSGVMKTLYSPIVQPTMPENTKCFACGKSAVKYTCWGRSY